MAENDTQTQDTQTTDTQTASWLDSLPDDLKGSDALSRFKDVPALAKSFLETKALVGANTVKLPERTASDEDWQAFYTKAGRPEKADGYQLPTEGLPDGFQMTDDGKAAFTRLAHDSGLTERQAATLYRKYAEFTHETQTKAQSDAKTKADAFVEAIKKEFGTAFDERLGLSKRLIDQFDDGDRSFAQMLTETGLGNHPAMFRFLSNISKQLAEDTILGEGKQTVGRAPAEAQAQIGQLQADSEFMTAYYDKDNPGHVGAKKRMDELYAQAYPNALKTEPLTAT